MIHLLYHLLQLSFNSNGRKDPSMLVSAVLPWRISYVTSAGALVINLVIVRVTWPWADEITALDPSILKTVKISLSLSNLACGFVSGYFPVKLQVDASLPHTVFGCVSLSWVWVMISICVAGNRGTPSLSHEWEAGPRVPDEVHSYPILMLQACFRAAPWSINSGN